MKKQKLLLGLFVLFIGMLCVFEKRVYASSTMMPTASLNIKGNAKIRTSSLVSLESGYMRVFYDSENNNIGIEYYDDNFNILSKKKLELELSKWGGFYAGSDAYYIVEGENNTDEDSSSEVIRVIKYDKNWTRLEDAQISIYDVRIPFDAGCVEMTEINGNLYIVTGQQGYVDTSLGNNKGHQGFLFLKVDENEMTGIEILKNSYHSFAQYIDYDDSNLYVIEESEGGRRTKLSKYDENYLAQTTSFKNGWVAASDKYSAISVLSYGGKSSVTKAVEDYASVNGIAISSENILGIGTSIDQSLYDSVTSETSHNIYLTVTPKDDFSTDASSVKWITEYENDYTSFIGVELTKINDDFFMISWEQKEEYYNASQELTDNDLLSTGTLHYIFIDGNGNKVSPEYTAPAVISDCKPVVKGSKIVYYASSTNMVDFYTIDANTGDFNKVIYRVAGENAKWSLDDDTLIIEGTGAITASSTITERQCLSSTHGFFISISSNWDAIINSVKKIVVKEGITSIPNGEFGYFYNVTEIILPKTMQSIGDAAFKKNTSLKRIVMLENITSIGEDVLWGGKYSTSGNKINQGTIYTTKGSYATTWAEENNVSYKYIDDLVLTDSTTNTKLEVLGESTTTFKVETLTSSNEDYADMLEKISENNAVISAYSISTSGGVCFGENTLTFSVPETLKGKSVTIIQKMSDGNLEEVTKTVDDNAQVTIETDELTSFMLVENLYIKGDLDKNGVVNANDAAVALDLYKYENATEEDILIGDIDGNGVINANDAALILDIYKYGN